MHKGSMPSLIATVTLVTWGGPLLAIFLVLVSGNTFAYEISNESIFINVAGFVSLILGVAFAAGIRMPSYEKDVVERNLDKKERVMLLVIYVLSATGGFLTYLKWKSLGFDPFSFSDNMLGEMNLLYAEEGRITTGMAGRLSSLSFVGVIYSIYLYLNRRLAGASALFFCISFLVFMVSPRRAVLLTSLIAIFMFWLVARRPSLAKLFVIGTVFFCVFIFLFGYSQYNLGKIDSFSIFDSIGVAFEYIWSSFYVMTSLLKTSHFEDTWIVMSVPARFLGEMFNVDPGVDLSIPFVYVPYPANTLPAFYYFFRSGGYVGVVFFGFLIGYAALLSARTYQLKGSFAAGGVSVMLLCGIVLSLRECLFITYDFVFWLIAVNIVGLFLKSKKSYG